MLVQLNIDVYVSIDDIIRIDRFYEPKPPKEFINQCYAIKVHITSGVINIYSIDEATRDNEFNRIIKEVNEN